MVLTVCADAAWTPGVNWHKWSLLSLPSDHAPVLDVHRCAVQHGEGLGGVGASLLAGTWGPFTWCFGTSLSFVWVPPMLGQCQVLGTAPLPARPLSQNHRIVGVGRDLCGSSSPTLHGSFAAGRTGLGVGRRPSS